tara:strand:- start:539 stop:1258 length:720 start_codon:yes stop_codon:yes gene_type:complete
MNINSKPSLKYNTNNMRKFLCEFIGTFTLVIFAAGAVMVDGLTNGSLGPIGNGLISGIIVAAIIYTFSDISGAHINPALSITAYFLGYLDKKLLSGYLIAQMAGSALAGYCLLWVLGNHENIGANLPNHEINISIGITFIIEFFLAFILMLVIAATGFDRRAHKPISGFVIGGVVAIEVMLMGPISGAAMNPARAFGPHLASGSFNYYWIYLLAPISGMLLGGLVYRVTHSFIGNKSRN